MYRAVANTLAASLLLLSGPLAADLSEVVTLIEASRYQNALQKLDSEPVSRRSRLLRAQALAGLKRSKEAETLYRSLIAEAPADPIPYNNLATLYAASGRLQEASTLLSEAMSGDPRYATVYKNLSRVYMEMSRNSYAKALRLSDQPQGLQLLSLNAGTPLPRPTQVAAASTRTVTPILRPRVTPKPIKAVAVVARAEPRDAPGVVMREPVATVAPSPAKAVASAPVKFDAGGAIAALKRWAAAWSAQNVEGYLAVYDADYLPPRGLSLAQWKAERRVRLQKPSKIEVTLSNYEVTAGGGKTLVVKASQRYRSDQYRDKTRKGFVLVPRNGVWKIGDEYTIGVIK